MDHKTTKIGKTISRRDAFTKVTGQEKYAADYYEGNFLRAGIKKAGIPHAQLTGINTEEALNIPGVFTVLTHKDIKGTNRHGLIRKDSPILVDEKIRHSGDAIALVLAETKEALELAIDKISFGFEPLPGVFSPEEALKNDAVKVHEDNPDGNIIRYVPVEVGNAKAAFSECGVIVESTFEVPRQEHAYLETEAGWSYTDIHRKAGQGE